MIAEAALALFGIYGVGWLMSGKTTVGALLMVGGVFWVIIAIVISIFTAGVGVCCMAPLHFAFIAASTVALANQRLPWS
ncbi:MAG TPA: hypothetical protein VF818_06750 [Ktedonobacterales bacterium]